MQKINDNFEISEGAKFELISEKLCLITSIGTILALVSGCRVAANNGGTAVAFDDGVADAFAGGTAEAFSDGTAVAHNGGTAVANNGGSAVAFSGGRAEAFSGGRAVAFSGGRAEAFSGGRICKTWHLANDGNYQLHVTDDGYFYAGCAVNLTREQALKRWDRDDDRACLFTLAILSLDWGKPLFASS